MTHPIFTEIHLQNLRKHYQRRPVLRGLTTTFSASHITLVTGPNGAGKTTLLSILSTLKSPSSGNVIFGKWSHFQARHYLRGTIGLLGDRPMLYRQLTVRENLTFFSAIQGIKEPQPIIENWLSKFNLTQYDAELAANLSRGMLQRLSLIRALIHNPQLILLDEPFTGLDSGSITIICQTLDELAHQNKIILLVSHDPYPLSGFKTHLVYLNHGKIKIDRQEAHFNPQILLDSQNRC